MECEAFEEWTCSEYGDCDDTVDPVDPSGDDCEYDNCMPYYDCTTAFSEFLDYCQYVECYSNCSSTDYQCFVDYTF